MPELRWHRFSDRGALDNALANRVAGALEEGLLQRSSASLVVSGGSTPRGVFTQLSQRPIDWPRVNVTLADERWVPASHADSNERLVCETLLQDAAAPANFVSLYLDGSSAQVAQEAVAQRLAALDTFDVVMLGMGEDGHTASLFPESTALAQGLDLANKSPCIAVTPPHAPHDRMSLTLQRLADTRTLILHITGDRKREVFEEAFARGDALRWPVAALDTLPLPEVDVYWAP